MFKLQDLVGRKVKDIFMGDEYLCFVALDPADPFGNGVVAFQVEGDCCSTSEFFDFYGVEALLSNGAVTHVDEVDLSPGDVGYKPETWEEGVVHEYDEVQVYGYRITTEHPTFGPQYSVFSFRNTSNGYYGGWMEPIDPLRVPKGSISRLTQDKVG